MPYFFRTYGCDGTDEHPEPHEFELFIKGDEHPKFCPVCGAEFEGEPEVIPGGGHIGGSAIQRTVDRMYREVERSSAERAELAGAPSLKVTDMQDRLREGDVAVKPPNNTVSQFMEHAAANGAGYGFGGGAMGGATLSHATSVPTPVQPNTITGPGHASLWGIQGQGGRSHAETARTMVKAGEWASDAPKR